MDWSKKIVQIMNTNAMVKEARHWQAVTSKDCESVSGLPDNF